MKYNKLFHWAAILASLALSPFALTHPGPRNIQGMNRPWRPDKSLLVELALAEVSAFIPYAKAPHIPKRTVRSGGSWSTELMVVSGTEGYRYKTIHLTTFPSTGDNADDAAFVFAYTTPYDYPFIWRPLVPAYTVLSEVGYNAKCAGHISLDDDRGSVFFFGGWDYTDSEHHHGYKYTRIFNPRGNGGSLPWFTSQPDMEYKRWYPGGTRLPDGRIFISTGEDNNLYEPGIQDYGNSFQDVPELFTPPQLATNPYQGYMATMPPSAKLQMETDYPYTTISPQDGNLLFLGPHGYDLDNNNAPVGPNPKKLNLLSLTWSNYGNNPSDSVPRNAGLYAGSYCLVDGVFYKSGGFPYDFGGDAVRMACKIDLRSASPSWVSMADLPSGNVNGRGYHYMVGLADASVLVIGGSESPDINNPVATRTPLLYVPWSTDQSWQELTPYGSNDLVHGYHSVAYLMRDGRVMLSGGELRTLSPDKYTIFTPPYLDGVSESDRPTVTVGATDLIYGTIHAITSTVKTGRSIAKYTLVSLPAPTHAQDSNQRVWTLENGNNFTGTETVAVPNSWQCPPGWYMLFAIDSAGVPSWGQYVRVWDGYERVYPTGLSCIEGTIETTHPVSDLVMGDNERTNVTPALISSQYRSTIEVTATAPFNTGITAIRIKTESQRTHTGNGASQAIELYRYTGTPGWETVGSAQSVGSADGRIVYTITSGTLSRFVSTGMEMKARVKMYGSSNFTSADWDVVELGLKQ